ncbi:ATP-dependent helicase [Eubacteriaceae bacterium ES3]|nr:ATP-dependent helicase [Eubacteriaceae bacterium ES3]
MKSYKAFKEKYDIRLNRQQEEALLMKNGQTLLLAVPGSGKTTVIINRIAYLIQVENVNPSAILALTFSRMGARDLKQRYSKSFGQDDIHFSTIHSFSLSVIRQYERQYHRKAFEVLANVTPVIRKLYQELFNAYPSENDLSEIVQRIGYVKNMMLSEQEIKALPTLEIDFYKLFEAFEAKKQRQGLMDFDDLLKYTYGLLKRHPEMLKVFKERYRYIHLDEAQDTSKIQFRIVELLTGKNGNLFMVGDEDQSIYGFRGAFPQFLLSFKEVWPTGRVLLMETNYRSSQAIVASANQFIKLNSERYEKKMETPNKKGIPVKREWVKSLEAQYRLILESIRKEGKETAVLYRNNESAIPLVDLLDREGVPFLIKEHTPAFFNHFIVKDIWSFYEFSKRPNDFELFSQLYYKMDLAISKDMVNSLKMRGSDTAIRALIRGNKEKSWLVARLETVEKLLNRLRMETPQKGIDLILDEMGYRGYLQFKIGSGHSEESLNQKLSVLKILAGRSDTFSEYFMHLEELSEKLMEKRIYQQKKPRVTLSTFHSSKGLEFEKVFVIDAVEGTIPCPGSREELSLFGEEVRLFYVGATRAKKELIYICVSDQKNGIFPSSFISYLIDGIPPEKPVVQNEKGAESFGVRNNFNKPVKVVTSYSEQELKAYKPGVVVTHRRFGKGEIIEKNGDVVKVNFEKAGNKKMNLSVCLENGVIH